MQFALFAAFERGHTERFFGALDFAFFEIPLAAEPVKVLPALPVAGSSRQPFTSNFVGPAHRLG